MWLCGRYISGSPFENKASRWEILGVFTSKERAVDRCKILHRDFIWEFTVDTDFPDGTSSMEDSIFPLLEDP